MFKFTQLRENSPLVKLGLEAQTVSLEAMAIAVPSGALQNRLTGIVKEVSGYVNGFVSKPSEWNNLIKTKDAIKVLENAGYAHFKDIEVYCAPGQVGSYLDTLDVFEECQLFVDRLHGDLIGPFSTWVAMILTTPMFLGSARGTLVLKMRDSDLEKCRSALSGAFSGKNGSAINYHDAIARHSDWSVIEKRTNALIERQAKINPKKFQESVNQLNENLTTLVESLQNDRDTFKISGREVDMLAKACHFTAVCVEFYAVYSTQLQSFIQATDDTVERLKDIAR